MSTELAVKGRVRTYSLQLVTEGSYSDASTRQDYLSSLPNELLDTIFSYENNRYPRALLHGPPSRRFLPFYLKAKYRSLWPNDSRELSTTAQRLLMFPERGQLVDDFGFSVGASEDLAEVGTILRFAPNLSAFYLSARHCTVPVRGLVDFFVELNGDLFGNLRRLGVSTLEMATSTQDETLDPRFVRWLERLPALDDLSLSEWHVDQSRMLVPAGGYRIRKLELSDVGFSGPGVAIPSTWKFVEACPSLSHLCLHSSTTPAVSLRDVLPRVRHPLVSLKITFSRLSEPLDPLIVHMTSLRSLTLGGDSIVSPNLHINLCRLTLLTQLSLLFNDYPSSSLETLPLLVSDGPYRLSHLKLLEVECETGGKRIGSPFDPTEKSQFGWEKRRIDNELIIPIEGFPPEMYQVSKELMRVASSRDLELFGVMFQNARFIDFFLLEAHNLVVGEAFYQEDLGDLDENRERAADYGFENPIVEIEEEEREDWELVKTEVIFETIGWCQEERWFSLSLVNKKDGSVMGEWKGL